ncbi:MAG TPA: aminodeoxychorismate synthase component I [Polyangiaceae bacterium]|nr:aminodeoxychorismate synthase component I [Polyangiaceae bacterium]
MDNNRFEGGSVSYFFHDPIAFCTATSPGEVGPALEQIEGYVRAGCHAVGYFSYELGYMFSSRLERLLPPAPAAPLFCVGIYRDRLEVSDRALEAALHARTQGQAARVLNCHLNMSRGEYLERLAKVKRHIFDGDTYQVNYTLKYKFRHEGSPLKLFADLRKRQRVEFGAYLDFPGLTLLSRSPELFVEKKGESMCTRPMKGTSKRGATHEQDRSNADFLARDTKTRAENVMIVDLLRNDLSRISHRGTVRTTELFKVETYETLHQMVSTITAKVDHDITLERVLRQLFPCGSITGAPKVRTMEIIRDLELEPRGVYTGAIGYLAPDRTMCLNVAIRTLALWPDGRGEMGVGGGIVHDSDPAAEYEECRLKGRFLTENVADFDLIECVRFDGAGYRHLGRHLDRLARSAEELGFAFDRGAVEAALGQAARGLAAPTKVRLVLDRQGGHRVECVPVPAPGREVKRIAVAPERVQSSNWALRHKVSSRPAYERAYERYRQLGYYDVIFTNERGEVTEGTFNNVFIRRGGRLYTPPVACGLLPGVQRQVLLESPEYQATERVLTLDDLAAADEVLLTNSIRGVVRTQLDMTAEGSPCCA